MVQHLEDRSLLDRKTNRQEDGGETTLCEGGIQVDNSRPGIVRDRKGSDPVTRMRAPTKMGPFLIYDLMTVVEWDPNRAITVSHQGAIRGTGRFEIVPNPSEGI
jgi:hypothetical protein